MFGLHPDSDHDDLEWDHKDMGASRKNHDEQDVIRLKEEFKAHNVFTTTSSNLINISNGDVAESLLNAQTKGQELSEAFINERLIEKKKQATTKLYTESTAKHSSLFTKSALQMRNKKMCT